MIATVMVIGPARTRIAITYFVRSLNRVMPSNPVYGSLAILHDGDIIWVSRMKPGRGRVYLAGNPDTRIPVLAREPEYPFASYGSIDEKLEKVD